MAILAIVMSVNFTACSNDDDTTEQLSSKMIGVWTQDGDNDIIVIEANGKGSWYENEQDYRKKVDAAPLTWTCSGNDCSIVLPESKEEFKMTATNIATTHIVWKDYELNSAWHDDYDKQDEKGYYRLWTWTKFAN